MHMLNLIKMQSFVWRLITLVEVKLLSSKYIGTIKFEFKALVEEKR
jgi:hypothetical protein